MICQLNWTIRQFAPKKQQNAEKKMQSFLGTKTLLGTLQCINQKIQIFPIGIGMEEKYFHINNCIYYQIQHLIQFADK